MIGSLFGDRLRNKFRKLEKKKAKQREQEMVAAKQFMQETSSETIWTAIKLVAEKGHPNEKKEVGEIKEKYAQGSLDFDDIIRLDLLYQSNCQSGNKGDRHE